MEQKKDPTLPYELIVEILLRLPVKSLLRFKCLSKSWLSFISDSQFTKPHFDLAASPTHRILLDFASDGNKVKSLDFEALLNGDSAFVILNFPLPLKPGGTTNYRVALGSCRGFVLLTNWETELVVWNPSTGVHKQIPGLWYKSHDVLYGIGYDSSTDDYLVVFLQLFQSEIDYFSLKTNSWRCPRRIDVRYEKIGYDSRPGLLLNGALHWLVFSNHTNCCTIIAFDLVERTLFEILLPHNLAMELKHEVSYLMVTGECLSLCCSAEGGRVAIAEIWVMKEYKVQSSWTKSYMQEKDSFGKLHYRVYRETLLSLPSRSGEAK